eukprot:366550-Chlamydomonas_euryale.AAC.4
MVGAQHFVSICTAILLDATCHTCPHQEDATNLPGQPQRTHTPDFRLARHRAVLHQQPRQLQESLPGSCLAGGVARAACGGLHLPPTEQRTKRARAAATATRGKVRMRGRWGRLGIRMRNLGTSSAVLEPTKPHVMCDRPLA